MSLGDLLGAAQELAIGVWSGALVGVVLLIVCAAYLLAWVIERLWIVAVADRKRRQWAKVQKLERQHLARTGLSQERHRRAS